MNSTESHYNLHGYAAEQCLHKRIFEDTNTCADCGQDMDLIWNKTYAPYKIEIIPDPIPQEEQHDEVSQEVQRKAAEELLRRVGAKQSNDAGELNQSVDETLKQRGNRYGTFSNHAKLSQNLQSVFTNHVKQCNQQAEFTDSQREALAMIFHKLARIGNGDPHYDDSWRDICGYSQLIVDELNGIVT